MIQYVDTGLPEEEHAREVEERATRPVEKKSSWFKRFSAVHVPRKAVVIPLIIIAVLLVLAGIFYLLYNHVYLYVNAEHLLAKRYADYNQAVEKGYCSEAYEFLSSATKEQISPRLYNFVCQGQRDYLVAHYVSSADQEVIFNVTGKTAVITAKRLVRDEAGDLAYSENYIFTLEHGNWYRDFPSSQVDFYYQEIVDGKNKVFLDCLVRKNEAEKETWLAVGQPQDWRYSLNEEGQAEYNLDAGDDHFTEVCAQQADNSESGQIMQELGL